MCFEEFSSSPPWSSVRRAIYRGAVDVKTKPPVQVCLSALSVRELTLYGTVSVANVTYHKHVFVRYTANGWQSHVDWPASYVPGSLADGVDQFEFEISVADAPLLCELAVCFEAEDGRRFWDNNGGANYSLRRCGGRPAASPRAEHKAPCGSWLHWL
ncbi:hypothetical protein HPB51_029415 [Rhipicephalus microplus]|uniref:CBM21 domain-containing protein n=1 Tax=Rhipicephalus microplus TaxID=6941 RepID=A0A9J6CUR5_RHIMP|nr:hypothetical protein HPB51_029415 [Rhipicephalus microplus]